MLKYILKWFKLGKVKDIYPIIREQLCSVSDKIFPQLREPGVYMFLDDHLGIIDIGEACGKGRALRTRIRNEIYDNSSFVHTLKKAGLDKHDLTVKIAIVQQGIDFNASWNEVEGHLRNIEAALICETDPWLNSHGGIDTWKREEVEIINLDDHVPLAPTIIRLKGKCPKKWIRD